MDLALRKWLIAKLAILTSSLIFFISLAFAYQGKDIVFRFIIEYSSLMEYEPEVIIIIGLFIFYMRIFFEDYIFEW